MLENFLQPTFFVGKGSLWMGSSDGLFHFSSSLGEKELSYGLIVEVSRIFPKSLVWMDGGFMHWFSWGCGVLHFGGLMEVVVLVRMRVDALRKRGLVHGESLAAELAVLMERRVSSTGTTVGRVGAMRCNNIMRNGSIGTEKFRQIASPYIRAGARNAWVIIPSFNSLQSKQACRKKGESSSIVEFAFAPAVKRECVCENLPYLEAVPKLFCHWKNGGHRCPS
ncbi:hypothetical protein B9Z19DRAFT_300354 [Tuber borchii]|uniref:Uncharacterized protein n=1 Tax=Tuber borchii TaxID=42251 RepID=A0A2T7A590_TUBBO|nr:hypothetical protein B9Z19DRAFT_300354 [Tuber borchii]